jgi:CheY-like chemotaxis protein
LSQQHPPQHPVDPLIANPGSEPAGPRILVVEDDADSRRLMQRLLRLWGYDALAAEDGPAAVEAAVAHRPRVALVDLGLPGLDGYEVARQIRAALGGAVRLVALTGYGEPEDRDRTAAAGFDLHLVKPVHPDRLSQTILDLLGQSGDGGGPPANGG